MIPFPHPLLSESQSTTKQYVTNTPRGEIGRGSMILERCFYPTSFPISKTSLFHLRLYSSFKTFIKQFWICKFLHHILEYFSCSVQLFIISFSYENIYYLHYYSVGPTRWINNNFRFCFTYTQHTLTQSHAHARTHIIILEKEV